MKYMGSKARISKLIVPIMLNNRRKGQVFVEPFVGGANITSCVDGNRLGADINPYLISMWQAVSKGWLPPREVSETLYNDIKNNKNNFPMELVGYVGFALSYGGKWFGGWRRDSKGVRNYVQEAYNNAAKQFPKLNGVQFIHANYTDIILPDRSIVYCDPPYKGTTKYATDTFDYDKFYQWCRKVKNDGHTVFVSEYNMPDDFTPIWRKEIVSSLTQDTGSKRAVETLFTL